MGAVLYQLVNLICFRAVRPSPTSPHRRASVRINDYALKSKSKGAENNPSPSVVNFRCSGCIVYILSLHKKEYKHLY
jgi:hypothetical protein